MGAGPFSATSVSTIATAVVAGGMSFSSTMTTARRRLLLGCWLERPRHWLSQQRTMCSLTQPQRLRTVLRGCCLGRQQMGGRGLPLIAPGQWVGDRRDTQGNTGTTTRSPSGRESVVDGPWFFVFCGGFEPQAHQLRFCKANLCTTLVIVYRKRTKINKRRLGLAHIPLRYQVPGSVFPAGVSGNHFPARTISRSIHSDPVQRA